MSVRDILHHLEQVYATQLSPDPGLGGYAVAVSRRRHAD
jgi:hypothetical protein